MCTSWINPFIQQAISRIDSGRIVGAYNVLNVRENNSKHNLERILLVSDDPVACHILLLHFLAHVLVYVAPSLLAYTDKGVETSRSSEWNKTLRLKILFRISGLFDTYCYSLKLRILLLRSTNKHSLSLSLFVLIPHLTLQAWSSWDLITNHGFYLRFPTWYDCSILNSL